MDREISTGLSMRTAAKLRIIGINFFIFVVLWGILEFICYKTYQHLPSKYKNGKRIVESNLGHIIDNTEQSIISHPYLLYTNNPNYFDSVQQHNSLGYRSPEFVIDKDKNTIRILTLGGSTTYGYLNKDPESTWPAILQRKMQKVTSKKIEVINGGLNYATSAELLASYVFRHRYIKADIIIFHEGGNDMAPVLFPNYNPEYTHFRSNGNSPKLRKGETFLIHSYVFRLFYSIWLNPLGVVYSSQPYSFEQLDKNEVKERVRNDANYVGFKRNVDLLIKLARMDSSEIFLMGFINSSKEKISETRSDLRNLVDEYIYAINKNNEIMKSLCLTHHINYIHLDDSLFTDKLFIDNCHLIEEGEELKAQCVFDQLQKLIK